MLKKNSAGLSLNLWINLGKLTSQNTESFYAETRHFYLFISHFNLWLSLDYP